jgi:gas vesicle protein
MTTNRGTFYAFLLGGVVGAGLALLFAPYSGAETRKRIREGADEAGDWTRERFTGLKTAVDEGTGRVKQMVVEKKEDIKAVYDAGKEAYLKGRERMKESSTS